MGNNTVRAPHLEWVPIEKMQLSEFAQRRFRPDHPVMRAARDGHFDIEAIGYPVTNTRLDGGVFVVDGWHRISGLKLIGWGDQQVQCEMYQGLTESQEAELFLARDDRRAIGSMEKFKIGVTAGRERESAIDKLVRSLDLQVAYYPGQKGAIQAVGILRKVYDRAGEYTLAVALATIRDAFGTSGLTASMIDGMSLVIGRYGDKIDGRRLVDRLQAMHGGVNGVINRAAVLQRQTGNQVAHCVAATIVQTYNSGAGGVKGGRLNDWWRVDK